MKSQPQPLIGEPVRRRNIRRDVLLLSGLALAFYFGFIYFAVTR